MRRSTPGECARIAPQQLGERGWALKLRVGTAVACAVGVWLCTAAPAIALLPGSSVTISSPTGTYLTDDEVTPSDTITGSGEATDVGPTVDINCYYGSTFQHLTSATLAGSSFSFSSTSLAPIAAHTCVLRAVAQGDLTDYPPGSDTVFTGPTLAISQVSDRDVGAGSNAGSLEDFSVFDSQLQGAFHFDSAGDCSIAGSYVYDPVTFASSPLDACSGSLGAANGLPFTPGVKAPTRSELQVDGNDAYVAADLPGVAQYDSGYPSLSYTYSIDSGTGNLTLTEHDQVVRCSPGGAFPATSASCASLVPTGVVLQTRIVQGQNGRVATVVQTFSSTDGSSHALDLLEDDQFQHSGAGGELSFPWTGAGLEPYTIAGLVLGGPHANGPGSFLIKGSQQVPDGSESSPQGAVTFSNPPESETIAGTTNSAPTTWVELHYPRTVPANGSVALGFTFSDGFLASDVASDVAAAQQAFMPTVSIASPANGARVHGGTVTVTGTASDASGLSTLAVAGYPATVGSGGAWSVIVPVTPGQNTIAAVATNVFGNNSQAQIAVNAPAPSVTKLSQSRSRWHEPGGTTFSFSLNLAGKVKLTFTQPGRGRKVGRRCVAANGSNHRKPSCTYTAGTLTANGRAGHNSIKFTGALSKHSKLRPGRYTVLFTATAGGVSSGAKKLKFTIQG